MRLTPVERRIDELGQKEFERYKTERSAAVL